MSLLKYSFADKHVYTVKIKKWSNCTSTRPLNFALLNSRVTSTEFPSSWLHERLDNVPSCMPQVAPCYLKAYKSNCKPSGLEEWSNGLMPLCVCTCACSTLLCNCLSCPKLLHFRGSEDSGILPGLLVRLRYVGAMSGAVYARDTYDWRLIQCRPHL